MSMSDPSYPTRRLIRGLLAVITAGVLVLAAACGGTKGGTTSQTGGDTLFIGTVNPIASWNAINQGDTAGQWAMSFVMDSLLVQPEPLDFQPKLANSIDTEDNKTYTVELNPNAKWSDGKPVTADDVMFTLNLIAHPDSATTEGNNMTMFTGTDDKTGKLPKGETEIPGLKAVDEHTVEFKMKTPVDANWVKEMVGTGFSILPAHVLADIAPADFDDSEFAQQPTVFSGPYKIANYTQNVSLELTANSDYYLGAPKIKTVIQKFMPAANLAGELQSGAIQMNSGGGIGNIPITDLPTMQKMENVEVKVNPTVSYQTMQFNTANLTDRRLRLGIAHAINRQQIVDQLLKGNAEILDGPFTSQSPYSDTELEPIPYDPEKAKQLIAESGWDTKKPIKFLVPTGNATREQAADVIEQNLKAVGLNVKAERYDFPTVLAMEQDGKFDLGLVGLSPSVDPDVSSWRLSTGPSNHSNYDKPINDELLIKAKQEPDPEKRREIYRQLQELWQQDMPILTTYSEHWVGAKSKTLKVGGPKPFWNGTIANLQDWELAPTDG
jgi:peptide/nickel transport system substrate-binding protein